MNLSKFSSDNLFSATTDFFEQLSIKLNSNTAQALGTKAILGDFYKDKFSCITELYFAGIIENSVFGNGLFGGYTLQDAQDVANNSYEGLMLFAVTLDKYPTRADISELTRAFNRISRQMPVGLLLNYEIEGKSAISLALSERFLYKQTWRDGEKVGKIIILRDIDIENTHSGHLRILQELANHNAHNFNKLHEAWLKVLNVQTLNDTFYEKLVAKVNKSTGKIVEKGWYFHCLENIKIDLTAASKILDRDIDNELKPQAVIRVIVRMMFIWFMKEKGLIKPEFFKRDFIEQFLKNNDTYYNAVLQNLFFGVLNKKIDERRFRKINPNDKYDAEGNEHGKFDVFRYKDFFKDTKADEFLEQTKTIPFVNGGLFQCHDYKFIGKNVITNEYNKSNNYLIDGFSETKRAIISDSIIFELIELFNSYVWTIEESTPTEQDIALEPELLGTVFENIIGFYNDKGDENKTENNRKKTGSYYTPKEIVDYMCKESLKETLKTKFPDLQEDIDSLIENHEDQLNFPQKNKIIAAITDLKVLDPACGSGAFPMGMFNLMVHTIEKLQKHKTTYENKLDIITNCIYGVDIQNIAVEISKLRFFISLLVDYPIPQRPEDFDVLPNLETKFVVANSLIGLKTQEARQLSAFDLTNEFAELTKIFLPYTTAKSPAEKTAIKNAFEKKKFEILKGDRFGEDTEKIRAWNPFNVCYCSPFFDPAIMFGLTKDNALLNPASSGGYFDIVIGNPPYISIEGLSVENRNLYKSLFKFFYHRYDIFGCFIEKGINILKTNGILCFIQPSVFLNSKSFMKIRNFIVNNCSILNLNLLKDGIFESAVVPTMIMQVLNNTKENNLIKCSQGKLENFYAIKQNAFFKTEANVFNLDLNDEAAAFIDQTAANTISLGEIARISLAINIGNHEKYLFDKQNIDTNSDEYIKVLKGGSIQKWFYEYKNLYLKKDFDNYVSCGDLEVLKKTKLMMKRIGKFPNVCFDDTGIAGVHTIYTIRILNDNFSPFYIMALLNSKLIGYIFRLRVPLKGDVFPEFRIFDLNKQIPIKNISLENQQPIITLVEQILQSKKQNIDTVKLEKKIDILVYKLYGLSYDEVKIIEPEFETSEEEYNRL